MLTDDFERQAKGLNRSIRTRLCAGADANDLITALLSEAIALTAAAHGRDVAAKMAVFLAAALAEVPMDGN